MKRRAFSLVVAIGVLALLPWPALATDSNGNHDAYQFLLGMAPAVGPDIAMAPNGSTVTMTGSGRFNAGPDKTASGGGTYTIKNAAGTPVVSGAFTVTGILEFVDYGDGTPQGLPAFTHGGQAKLGVILAGAGDGVLTVFCLLGSPPAGKEEGIALILGNGMNFTKPAGGETVFIKP